MTVELFLLVVLTIAVAFVVAVWRRREPDITVSDPGGHVRRIGIDCHARACVDPEGRVTCVCGLSMVEDVAGEWLDANPDMTYSGALALAWAELHGEGRR